MATSTARFPHGIKLHAEREMIDVTNITGSSEPDPSWSFTDAEGHEHTHESYTWRWVFDGPEFYFDADGEEHNGDGDYRCFICQETIEPRYVWKPPSSFRETMPGMAHYTIEYAHGASEQITPEQYQGILRALGRSSSEG